MCWFKVKCEKAEELGGWICEVCEKECEPHEIVGHHVINKSQGGLDTLENCRLRCYPCEALMHFLYASGNPPEPSRQLAT